MALTKKHFEAIALILDENLENAETYETHAIRRETLEWVTADLMHYFETENPQFDRARFAQAAGFPNIDS